MPALTMRGRYLMREYWSDSDLFLKLTAEERELYIGLWMLADDDGWMPRDVPGIAGALLRFEDRVPREARIRLGLRRLAAIGKVSSHRCGCLHLPAVSKYPRAGKKSSEHRLEHRKHQTDLKGFEDSNQTDLNPSPVPSRRNPSLPDVADARDPGGRSSAFDEQMTAHGYPRPQAVGGRR